MQVLFSVVLHKFFLLFLRISTPVFIVLHQFGVKIGVNIGVRIFPGIIAFQLSSCPFQVNMVVYFNRCFYIGMSHKILIRLNVHSRFGISCTCCVPENMWRKMTFIPSNSLILGPFCVILNSVPLKKTGSLLWRAQILSLINTFRAMPVHVSQDYDNGSL